MLLLLGAGGQAPVVRWSDISFCGRALCLRRNEEGLTVRALGLTRLPAPGWKLELEARQSVDFEPVLADGKVRWPRGLCPGLEVDVCHDGTCCGRRGSEERRVGQECDSTCRPRGSADT